MNIVERIHAAPSKGCVFCKSALESLKKYPTDVLGVLIYHRLHFHMDPGLAMKSYRQLSNEFVDWNEVRISPIREIQEQVSKGENSLELSVFIKDLLEFVHNNKHAVNLESIVEENLTDIRRYLRQARGMEPASVDLVLMRRKEHPVIPLTSTMEQMFLALGLVSEQDSRDRKQKSLFELVGPEAALAFHHLALNHCRMEDALKKAAFKSSRCALQQISNMVRKKGRGGSRKTATRRSTRRKSEKMA